MSVPLDAPLDRFRVLSGGRRYFAQLTEEHDLILSAVPKTANRLYQKFRRSSPPGKVQLISYQELADELGCTLKTIRNNLEQLAKTGLLRWRKLGVRSGYAKVAVLDPWQLKSPSEPVEQTPDESQFEEKSFSKGDLNSLKQPSNPHSSVPSFKESRDLQTGVSLESDSEPTTHPVSRTVDGEGRVESELTRVGEVLPYLPQGQADFEEADSFEAQEVEAVTEPCEAVEVDAVLSTGKPRPVTRTGLQNKTNSGEDSNSAAAAFFAELERFLGRCLKAPHRKYIRQLGEGRWRDVRLVAEQIVQGRGTISDPDRYFTAALKKLLDGTWNLVTLSRVNRDDRLSSEQAAWLDVAEGRGLLVKGYREGPAYFCELRPGLPGCSEPKLLHQVMTWWPLAWLSQKSGQLTSAELKSILNSARISRGLDPV